MSPLMAQSGHIEASVRLSAFGAKRTCALVWLRRPRPLMTGTVEKGFWGRSLSNIDSRSNATAQSRFKNPFVRIRLFQILIPQLHFGDFFNSIGPKRTWCDRLPFSLLDHRDHLDLNHCLWLSETADLDRRAGRTGYPEVAHAHVGALGECLV